MEQLLKEKKKYGNLEIYGISKSENKGSVVFIHGFNSSYKIWGNLNESDSFINQFFDCGYNCYAINFSNTILTSIKDLADKELERCIYHIHHKFHAEKKIIFIAHSLGGIILRYFLDLEIAHSKHNLRDLKKQVKILLIALLASPNHGISVSSSVFQDSKKKALIKKNKETFFQVIDSETSLLNKIKTKFQSNVIPELYFDSKLMYTLNSNVSSNLWPEIPIYNYIASNDVVVNPESAKFKPNEIKYHNNFHQQEFKSVHMKNPLEWNELTEFLNKKELRKIKNALEDRIPGLKYFMMKPIYQNLNVIKTLKKELNC